MKIGIDIRAACGKKTGKGWYTYNLVKELLALDKVNQYILYSNSATRDLAFFQGSHVKIINKNRILWHFEVIKDWKKSASDRDIFFAPTSYIIPAFLPKKYHSVITVHDLIAFLHPHLHHTKSTIIEHLLLRRALKKTSTVLVPSLNTKKDLVRVFQYPEKRIVVTPLASCHSIDPSALFMAGGLIARNHISNKYNLPENYILTVSGLEPRKNVDILIDVFQSIVKNHPNLKLIIVGGKGWKSKKTEDKVIASKQNILWIQNCDSKDLSGIYNLAKVFVFPSLYEGFGLPPLEAMEYGCPVICSNAGSLKEIVGDAALLFDPIDKEELTSHLEKVLNNPNLREELIKKGKTQAAMFSWKKTAKKTLDVFEKQG